MKLRNAPARKLSRQIAAKQGGSCRYYENDPRVALSLTIRTKKRRASKIN